MDDVPVLACIDLPCLVEPANGVAESALDRALRRVGVEPDTDLYRAACGLPPRWPGRTAAAWFSSVFSTGSLAATAAAAYDDAFGACVARRGASIRPGAVDVVAALRGRGTTLCLTTEFSAATREALLDVLLWPGLVTMLVSAEQPGSEPHEVITSAAARVAAHLDDVAVVSGTTSGVAAGAAARVGWVVGVPGQSASSRGLLAAGATHVASLHELATEAQPGRVVSA